MITFSEIIERLKDIVALEIGDKKVYDKDVAHALGLSAASFATMKKREKIPYDELMSFCSMKKISINWLLFNQNPSSLVESTNRFSYVKYFPDVSISAGGGAWNEQEEYEILGIEEQLLDRILGMGKGEQIEAVNVSGDSMEPGINDGSVVFIDRGRVDITKGGIFAVLTPAGLFVKRLQLRLDGAIDIISDNKDYPVQVVNSDEVSIVGKVIGQFGEVF
jgi:SOS-response transcriptional repressor LexA